MDGSSPIGVLGTGKEEAMPRIAVPTAEPLLVDSTHALVNRDGVAVGKLRPDRRTHCPIRLGRRGKAGMFQNPG